MSESTLVAREFLRVSQDRSRREKSPKQQHADHEKLARQQGWQLHPDPYTETVSASRYGRKPREGFQSLCEDLATGNFGAQLLLMWEGSRGSRKVSEWVHLIELCEAAAVNIYIWTNRRMFVTTNPHDVHDLIDIANGAQLYSAELSQRVRRDAADAAQQGKPAGHVPYGYRRIRDIETGEIAAQVEVPHEAKVIRELFDRLGRGDTLSAIARDFQQRGIRSRTGKVFSPQYLRALALNRTYAGLRVHDPAGRMLGPGKLSPTATVAKGTWEPIVPEELFFRVYARLTDPARVIKHGKEPKHLLSMVACCNPCGAPMMGVLRKEGWLYRCRGKGCVQVSRDALDDLATRVILGYLGRDDVQARLRAQLADAAPDVTAALARARAERRDAAAYKPTSLREMQGKAELLETLDARIADLERELEQRSAPAALAELIGDPVGAWERLSLPRRRDVVKMLLRPDVIGQLTVTAAGRPPRPVWERVEWRRS